MTKKEAIHFLYQIADEIRSFLDKTSSPKGQWTSHKRLEALSMAISALYDLFQAEEDGRLIIPPCKVGDTVWVITGTAIKLCTVDRIHILGNGQVQIRAKYFVTDNIYLYPDMFGKTVFLTCAEAEAAIEARGGQRVMTNYENLKAAAQSLGDFCDNHEDCDGCTLSALCECMPAALPKLINAIAENKEKSGGKK